MNHSSLYRNELTHLGYGNPVWEPNPDTLYDCIRIGDVGYFQNDQFIPLFNILPLASDDLNGNYRLPFPQPNFQPLVIPDNLPIVQRTTPLQAGVYALESSLTFSASVGVDRWAWGFGIITHSQSWGLQAFHLFITSQCWIGTPWGIFSIFHQRERSSTHSSIRSLSWRYDEPQVVQRAHAQILSPMVHICLDGMPTWYKVIRSYPRDWLRSHSPMGDGYLFS